MRAAAHLLAAMALTSLVACQKAETPVEKAKRRYEMVKENGTDAERCSEGRKLVEAYLDAGEQENYKNAKRSVSIDCDYSEMKARNS